MKHKELDLTRKLDIGEIFEWSFKLFGRHFGKLIKTISYFIIPGIILIIVSIPANMGKINRFLQYTMKSESMENTSEFMGEYFSSMTPFFFIGFILGCLSLLISIASIRILSLKLDNQEETEFQTVLYSLKMFIPIVLSFFFPALFLIFGYMACFIPGVILGVYMIFILQAIIIENKLFFGAFARSFSLVNKNFWSLLGIFVVFYFIFAIASSIISMPFYMVGYVKMIANMIKNGGAADPEVLNNYSNSMTTTLPIIYGVSLLLSSVYIILLNYALVIKYYNIRNLKEGMALLNQIDEQMDQGVADTGDATVVDTEKPEFDDIS